jgi:sugar O-acyltransferase (sialic acid O-acetyltransferase NeuD family)
VSLTKPRAFVWGASGHAKVVADAALLASSLEVVGFFDELRPERDGEVLMSLPIWAGADGLSKLRERGVTHALLGVGDCDARYGIWRRAAELGFSLPTVVHPRSVVASNVILGVGSVVLAGAVINVGSTIGAAVIVNTAATVDHDCQLGDGVHLSPGVHLAGGVRVGERSWIGIGTSVIQGITVGARSIVGAGSTVLRDVPDDVIAFGCPCQARRARSAR